MFWVTNFCDGEYYHYYTTKLSKAIISKTKTKIHYIEAESNHLEFGKFIPDVQHPINRLVNIKSVS